MDDAFTLLRQAVDLLPPDAVAENGQTMADVRRDIQLQEWEMALDVLIEIADVHPASITFWEKLAEAARQMMLDRSRRWCDVRLAPLQPARWQHLKPGDVITMHEAQPVAGIAHIIEVLPPRA